MPKKIPIEPGTKFGHLTVIQEDEPIRDKDGRITHITYLCECDCENHTRKIIRAQSLRSGHTQSCGCLQRQKAKDTMIQNHKTIDLTNKTFGFLKVLEKTEQRINQEVVWKCQCQYQNCNRIIYYRTSEAQEKIDCGCHNIKSKGEEKISQLLIHNNIQFEREKSFCDCRDNENNRLRFDFFIDNKYLIEYDGIQHFKCSNSSLWDTEEHLKWTQLHDKIKNQWCKDNNIQLIRIPYWHYEKICLDDLLLETSKFII